MGKTVNLQGTARIKVNVSQYGRDMQLKHQILEDVCRIQPLPMELTRDNKGQFVSKDNPKDILIPEFQTRTARTVAVIRHTVNNARTRLGNLFINW